MSITFNFYQESSIEEARELLVYATESYLSDINNDEEVRPYLHNYPFTYKNIRIAIHFYKKDGNDVSSEVLSIAVANKGRVDYYMDDPKDPKRYALKEMLEETFEDSQRLCKQAKDNSTKDPEEKISLPAW